MDRSCPTVRLSLHMSVVFTESIRTKFGDLTVLVLSHNIPSYPSKKCPRSYRLKPTGSIPSFSFLFSCSSTPFFAVSSAKTHDAQQSLFLHSARHLFIYGHNSLILNLISFLRNDISNLRVSVCPSACLYFTNAHLSYAKE